MNSRLILNLSIFLLLIFVILVGVKPAFSSVSNLRGEAALRKDEVEKERQVLEKIKSLSGAVDSRQSEVKRLEEAIPNSESKPELISIMENLASQNGLGLITISAESLPDDPKSRKERVENILQGALLKTLKLDLKLTGNYEAFKSWLDAAENNLRIFDIQNISFSVKENSGSQDQTVSSIINPVMEYAVSVLTYVVK
jgi:Tfp pilus assembly protein PilO